MLSSISFAMFRTLFNISISHTCDKNIPFYSCLRFFCLGFLVSVLGLYSCLKLSIIAIYRISVTTFITSGLGLQLQNVVSILDKQKKMLRF